MVGRTLRWSKRAENSLTKILAYYRDRNESSEYSDKLSREIHNALERVVANPYMGHRQGKGDFRFVIVYPFQVFYRVTKKEIRVSLVWDARRNPDTLKLTR